MIWENGIKTCIISYKKRIASPGSMQDTGSLGLLHWDDPDGWPSEKSGESPDLQYRSTLSDLRRVT